MTGDAPPTRHDELCAPLSFQGFQLLHPRVLRVSPEQIFLVVGGSEDEVAQRIQQDDACDGQPGEVLHRESYQRSACLKMSCVFEP